MPRSLLLRGTREHRQPGSSHAYKKPENQLVFGAREAGTFPAWVRSMLLPTLPVKGTDRRRSFTFSHPDYTVGSGVPPDPASNSMLAGYTAGRELGRI